MDNVAQYGPANLPVYPPASPDNAAPSTQTWLAPHPKQQHSPTEVFPENEYGSPSYSEQGYPYPSSPTMREGLPLSVGPQIAPSIGPTRITTRRQARAQSALQLGIRDRACHEEEPAYFMSPASPSRPQTPASATDSPHRPYMAPGVLPSPRYLPTPVSGSPYSPFSLYHSHSRTASSYSTSNPRSASPALSVASALTSISSSSATPNTQSFAPYPLPSPPGGPVVPRAKQRKQRLFNVDRKAICVYHQENPNARQEDIAARYGVERSTISKILKHKTKWMNVPEDDDMRVAKHRPSKFPEVEEELVTWLVQMKQQNTLLTDALIRNKAKETARSLQIPDERFKASSGWVENFKHRHNIRKGVWLGAQKTLRTHRGVGATHLRKRSNESVLSPLNPAFNEARSELARQDSATAEDGDDDMESEDDRDLDPPQARAGPSHSQTEPSPSHNLPPIWTLQQEPLPANEAPISSHPPATHSVLPPQPFDDRPHEPPVAEVHQTSLQLTQPPIPPQQGVALPEPGPGTFPEAVVVYQPAPPITSGNTIPNLAEAEDAINKVILFMDSQNPPLLTPDERGTLAQIKYVLFQAGSGLPFGREQR